jgi:hypothetical protein
MASQCKSEEQSENRKFDGGVFGAISLHPINQRTLNPLTMDTIWVNQPIQSFLVGYLNPCLQVTSVRVGLPQPHGHMYVEFDLT